MLSSHEFAPPGGVAVLRVTAGMSLGPLTSRVVGFILKSKSILILHIILCSRKRPSMTGGWMRSYRVIGFAVAAWIGSGVALWAATCSVPSGGYPTIQAAVDDPVCTQIDLQSQVYQESDRHREESRHRRRLELDDDHRRSGPNRRRFVGRHDGGPQGRCLECSGFGMFHRRRSRGWGSSARWQQSRGSECQRGCMSSFRRWFRKRKHRGLVRDDAVRGEGER